MGRGVEVDVCGFPIASRKVQLLPDLDRNWQFGGVTGGLPAISLGLWQNFDSDGPSRPRGRLSTVLLLSESPPRSSQKAIGLPIVGRGEPRADTDSLLLCRARVIGE